MNIYSVKEKITWSVETDPEDENTLILSAIGFNSRASKCMTKAQLSDLVAAGKYIWQPGSCSFKWGTQMHPIQWLIHDLTSPHFLTASLQTVLRFLRPAPTRESIVPEVAVVGEEEHLIARVGGRTEFERDAYARAIVRVGDAKILLADVLHLLSTDSDLEEVVSNPKAYKVAEWKLRVAIAHLNGWDVSSYNLEELWENAGKQETE